VQHGADREASAQMDASLVDTACRVLHLDSASELEDLLCSLILSESTYKQLEMTAQEVAQHVASCAARFPEGLVQLQALELTLSDIPQLYLVAQSPSALYVAFMGTKRWKDIVTGEGA
jgi:hypothetical protein